jgi:tripartite-type tricarboxylate transporter receptor subunit TctC
MTRLLPLMGLFPAAVCAAQSTAQPYPAKPVRFIAPYPPGGPNDVIARIVAVRMAQVMGQQWIVENRPGRGGNIGTELAAKSAADGYTLVHGGMGSLTLAPFLSKLPYDTLRDFAPVTVTARAPNVIAVHPALPARSVRELLAFARTRPGELNYATSGVGSTPHLAAALFVAVTRIQLTHIPYKGSAPAVVDLIAGQVPILFTPISPLLPHIESGKARALAVSSLQRSPLLPTVPAAHESGAPGFEMNPWFGMLAPTGTPPEIVARLNAEVTHYLRTAEAAKQLAAQGADPGPVRIEEFVALIKSDLAKWGKVIRDNDIRNE